MEWKRSVRMGQGDLSDCLPLVGNWSASQDHRGGGGGYFHWHMELKLCRLSPLRVTPRWNDNYMASDGREDGAGMEVEMPL